MQYNKTSISRGCDPNILLDFFFLWQRKTTQLNLQKDVISTQKQPSCKKGVALCKMASMKKLWNTGGGQEMAVMVGQWQKF